MGGGDHLEVNVVSEEFSGLTLVQQHQLVYGALKNELKTETIHALALKTSNSLITFLTWIPPLVQKLNFN